MSGLTADRRRRAEDGRGAAGASRRSAGRPRRSTAIGRLAVASFPRSPGRPGIGGGGGSRALLGVDARVSIALVAARERPRADVAGERFLAGVRSDVRRQVVAAAEGPFTDGTPKRLLSGVYAHVAGQLVATREAAVARLVQALVRSVARRRRRRRRTRRRRCRRRCPTGARPATSAVRRWRPTTATRSTARRRLGALRCRVDERRPCRRRHNDVVYFDAEGYTGDGARWVFVGVLGLDDWSEDGGVRRR